MATAADERLAGTIVLVVEDELLLAMSLEATLHRHGCRVLGPAPSIERALALLEDEEPDAALLDVNLRGQLVTPVAAELRSRGVPFVLVTGYNAWQIGEAELQSAPILRKPVANGEVRRALEAALAA